MSLGIGPGDSSSSSPPTIDLPADPQLRYRDPLAGLVRRHNVTSWKAFVFGVLVYGVGEKLILPAALGYLVLGGELSRWRPDVEALVSGFVLVPTILAAYVWQIEGVRAVFVGFARRESFTDSDRFNLFIDKARQWFRKNWWLLALTIAALGVVFQGLWLWEPDNPKPVPPWWQEGEPTARWVALTLAVLPWYAAAQIVIGEVRLAWTLRRLWSELGGDFILRSERQGGGLASLSRHVSILATVGAVVLLNLILGLLLPQIRDVAATPDFLLWVVIIWAAYLIVVPGITLILVWPAHEVMIAKRAARMGRVAAEIDDQLELAERHLDTPDRLEAHVTSLDGLRKLRAWLDADLPKWPLPEPVRAISWSTVVPISLTVLTIVLDRVA